jgi:hypothetical protein
MRQAVATVIEATMMPEIPRSPYPVARENTEISSVVYGLCSKTDLPTGERRGEFRFEDDFCGL